MNRYTAIPIFIWTLIEATAWATVREVRGRFFCKHQFEAYETAGEDSRVLEWVERCKLCGQSRPGEKNDFPLPIAILTIVTASGALAADKIRKLFR